MMRDLLIVTPPFSPFDAGPPLGPGVLVAHSRASGLEADAIDLNIRYLRLFSGGSGQRLFVVGDHAKDRERVEAARGHFATSLCIEPVPADLVPCSVDPVLALPHGFAAIHAAVNAMLAGTFWPAFFQRTLGDGLPPRVLGISIMGPAQVLPALALARWARQAWPDTVVVGGGSHVTLLADEIASDERYAHDAFHAFTPGHSEHVLADFVAAVRDGRLWPESGVLVAGLAWRPCPDLSPDCWLPPAFGCEELHLYCPQRLSLPIQLARGCAYGRCTFCTYPAVEAATRGSAARVAQGVLATARSVGAKRVSVKDSLFDHRAMQAFSKLVAAELPGLAWSCTTKLNQGMTTAWLKSMCGSGLQTVELGVETIHPRLQAVIDKRQPLELVDRVIGAHLDAGIAVVVNLLYGLPGETLAEARAQRRWFDAWRRRSQGRVYGSHNLVEVNRQAPFALAPRAHGIELGPIGPWAFSYVWNAPTWRKTFAVELDELESGQEAA